MQYDKVVRFLQKGTTAQQSILLFFGDEVVQIFYFQKESTINKGKIIDFRNEQIIITPYFVGYMQP